MSSPFFLTLAGALISGTLLSTPTAETDPGGPAPVVRDRSAAADGIDEIWREHLAAADLEPAERISDVEFVRRAYLRLAGRIPTLPELEAFADGGDRSELISELVGSDAFQSRMYHLLADMLRHRSNLGNQTSGEPYAHFIKQSLADNMPYDEFVRQLLTAEGPAHARGFGATGYFLRDRGMPHDNMANTMRIFAGTRMECAQCHDHPFEDISQKDFFAMSAYTGGLRYGTNNLFTGEDGPEILRWAAEMRRDSDRNVRRALGRVARQITNGVSGSGAAGDRLPADYQYEDAKPRSLVSARTLYGDTPQLPAPRPMNRAEMREARQVGIRANRSTLREVNSREAFADWLASPSNDRFNRVIANRMWKAMFGVALTEPFDDYREDTVSSAPELEDHITALMVEVGYDLREFSAILASTDLFQRAACAQPADETSAFPFRGPLLERATAEQVWDSLLTLLRDDPDATLTAPGARAEFVYERYDEVAGLDEEGLQELVDRELLRYTDPDKFRQMRRQELRSMNQERQAGRRELQREFARRTAALRRDLRAARQRGDAQREAQIQAEIRKIREEIGQGTVRDRRNASALVRASELASPAPAGHFLRVFGQSDRETIDNSRTVPEVPQALRMMNDVVDKVLMGAEAAIRTRVVGADSDRGRVTIAFRSILGRDPTRGELRDWTRDFDEFGPSCASDLVWTLVNSHEFRTIR